MTYILKTTYVNISDTAEELPVDETPFVHAQDAVDMARIWISSVVPPPSYQPRASVVVVRRQFLHKPVFSTWVVRGEIRERDYRRQGFSEYTTVKPETGLAGLD